MGYIKKLRKKLKLNKLRKWFNNKRHIKKQNVDDIIVTTTTQLEKALTESLTTGHNMLPKRYIIYNHTEQEIIQFWFSNGQIMYLRFSFDEFINIQEENIDALKCIKKYGKYMGGINKETILEIITKVQDNIQENLQQIASQTSEENCDCHKNCDKPKEQNYIG